MSLRKKKVEDTLSKLFSSKAKSTPAPSSSTESLSQTAQPHPVPESAQPSQIETSSRAPTPSLPEAPVAGVDSPLPDSRLDEGRETRLEEALSLPVEDHLPQSSPVALAAAQPTPLVPNETVPSPSAPSASKASSPQNASGDGRAATAESEIGLPHEATSEEIAQLVIFTLAGEFFGLPIDRVESIIKPQAITVVPHARPYVVGVTNLRGTVLPVIDLRRRFQLPMGEQSADQRIMVVLFNEEKIGLQVDSVTQVLRVPLSAIEPPPPLVTAFVHSAFVTGIAKVDERLVILLDLEKVLLPHNES